MLAAIFCFSIKASEPTVWKVNSRAEVLRGDARNVSITDTGAIILAPRFTEIFNTQQSFVWSSAVDASGNIFLGTGSDGRLFKVDATGKSALLTDFNELDVTALAVGKDNSLFAATSPDGKVYRVLPDGKAEIYFDPADKYIWSLTISGDNNLIVGTGENGKIYRVKKANDKPEEALLFDSSETHIISLNADRQGNIIAGTDAGGIVLKISAEGKAFALLDAPAPLREIHEIAVGADNSIYVLALSDSASSGNNSGANAASGATVNAPAGATATVSNLSVADDPNNPAQPPAPPRSRNDLSAVKSAVFRILPDGSNQIVWSSIAVTAFSLAVNPNGDGVLVGTSDKGRIYSVTNDGRETLLLQSNENQISTLKVRNREVFATSSNGGKLFKFDGETVAEGSFESNVRDARSTALWGRVWWGRTGIVGLQTRTGNTEKPDATWSDWSAVYEDPAGAQITSPKARFFQYRAILKNGGNLNSNTFNQQISTFLNEVNVSYLPDNIAPEVLSIQILPTNVGLQSNILPPLDPNIESSGLDPTAFGLPPTQIVAPRRIYQRGARSLQWTAEDRNGDKLEYAVYYRGVNETTFRLLKENLPDNFYTIDGATLADGNYVFKIIATDISANALGQSLRGERVTDAVAIDNTAPVVTAIGTAVITGEKARAIFEANDVASGVRRAEISLDGREWQTVYSDDGISDGNRERYTIEIPVTVGEHTISLRAFDANGNAGSFRINLRR